MATTKKTTPKKPDYLIQIMCAVLAVAVILAIVGFSGKNAAQTTVAELTEGTTTLEAQVEAITAEKADLEAQVAELTAQVEEAAAKDETIATLEADVAAKDEAIATMEADVAAKDEAIATMEADVTAKDEAIATMEADVAAKAEAIATLEADVAAKAEAIATLEATPAVVEEVAEEVAEEATEEVAEEATEKSDTATVNGFAGPIEVTLTVDANGAIVSMVAGGDAFAETSGFGTKVQEEAFTSLFVGLTEKPVAGENVDTISGATVSSKAVIEAAGELYDALTK